jgi:hypothetical protein
MSRFAVGGHKFIALTQLVLCLLWPTPMTSPTDWRLSLKEVSEYLMSGQVETTDHPLEPTL